MNCPHLKEVVMVYCEAFPLRKLVPADRVSSTGKCACADFAKCPVYLSREAKEAEASLGLGMLPVPAR